MVLICRHLCKVYSALIPGQDLAEAEKNSYVTNEQVSSSAALASTSQSSIPEETEDYEASGPAKGELSEEAHLFAKFTCTYKIEDFLKHEGGGNSMPNFPQNEVVQVRIGFWP